MIQEGVPLVECVPNVSEGRRTDVIASLTDSVAASGSALLDASSDPSHNRTVLTLAGTPSDLEAAVDRLFGAAIPRIDLRQQTGVHPRLGAVDVVPFVPLDGATMADCVQLAVDTARLVAARHDVPVYLYEEAASRPERRSLAAIRRGGLARLAERMREEAWAPDFGGSAPHPTAGVTVIGARGILVAFNVNLKSDRLELARRIAASIREAGGGLPAVRAMGVPLADRRLVQVSMNLIDYRRTSMMTAFDIVERQAADAGVAVLESEIVGLVPAEALPPDPARRLQLRAGHETHVLEDRLAAARHSR